MAKFNGGIFSRARNSIGGITFLKSRVREGTAQTAREKVKNSDAMTTAQLLQREKLKYAVDVERLITTPNIKPTWDYSISKLPAYQSFVSYLLNSMSKSATVPHVGMYIPKIGAGKLHTPDSFSISGGITLPWQVNWSTELGDNGSDYDSVVKLIIGAERNSTRQNPIRATYTDTQLRVFGNYTAGSQLLVDYYAGMLVIIWFEKRVSGVTQMSSKINAFYFPPNN